MKNGLERKSNGNLTNDRARGRRGTEARGWNQSISLPEIHLCVSVSGRLRAAMVLLLSLLVVGGNTICFAQTPAAQAQEKIAAEPAKKDEVKNGGKLVQDGIEIEFTIEAVARDEKLMEGADAVARFKVTDARNHTPITNLRPASWMDLKAAGKMTDPKECRQKIQSFLQASLSSRPEIDLNTYFILTLNKESNISVIDPLMGYGTSKLFTLVFLKSPGEDWALTADNRKLFVSMPLINQVAVVDTGTWRVTTNVDAGAKPSRIALQPDQKYLWVGNDASDATESGVTVIDVNENKVAAKIKTGAGHHEFAFTSDNSFAFVTNKDDGTLTIIDAKKLAKMKEIKTGAQPVSIAYSDVAKAVYVANEGDGSVIGVSGENLNQTARLAAKPGLRSIRFAQNGRWGFVVNARQDNVLVFDTSTNRFVNTIQVGRNPDQITFTKNYAYVRSLGSDHVALVQLDAIGKKGEVPVLDFPAGQFAPERAAGVSMADAIAPAPEDSSVLVANPADQAIYYYSEGMAAPMGTFQNYRREPRAVMVWNKSLRELQPGVYSTNIKLTSSGQYDVAFLLDSPRVAHCFDMAVAANPAIKHADELPIAVEAMFTEEKIRVGEPVKLRFKVTDTKTNHRAVGLKDFGVMVMLASGTWQHRQWATQVEDGVYEISFAAPKPGPYYVFVQCPSMKVGLNKTPYHILQAADAVPRNDNGATTETKKLNEKPGGQL
ncbi:MAG TPA: YncE family protein [Blastocatellia bacterium]|nr:YncE family protein [Blastocatellia bacterium]